MSILAVPIRPATPTRSGSVRTDVSEADPLVVTKATHDGAVSSLTSATASASATAAAATATATAAQAVAAAAQASADAAVGAAAGFPVDDFLGTIIALDSDPGAPAANSGKWWQIGVAGTLSHGNAGGLVVGIGDRILCDGSAWLRYLTPPTYIPEGSLPGTKISALTVERSRLAPQLTAAIPDSEDDSDFLYGLLDAARRLLIGVRRSTGDVVARLARDVPQTFDDVTLGGAQHRLDDYDEDLMVVADASGRVVLRIRKADGSLEAKVNVTEVIEARGGRASLSDRLAVAIDAYGVPVGAVWGEHFLAETRQRLRTRALGEARQLVIASIGDSWSHNYTRWIGPATDVLQADYGSAGPGWCGFAWPAGSPSLINGSAQPALLAVSTTGSWTPTYASSTSPDLGHISSSAAGDKVTVSGPAGSSAVVLYHMGGGAIRYRWDGGAWTNSTLSGSTLQTLSLAGVPGGAWSLEIEVVSGTPVLAGVDVQASTSGVRVHKLGATGSRASQWAAVDAAQWQAGMAALAPHLVVIMHGTNDQAAYDAESFRGYLQTIVSRVRAALPAADLLLVAPCENQRGLPNAMSGYTAVMRQLAVEERCACIDLQPYFGDDPADYAAGSARPWFNADQVHPEPATGGRAIVDAILRVLTQR